MLVSPAVRREPPWERVRPSLLAWGPAAGLLLSVGLFAALWVALGTPFHPFGRLGFFDLKVYRLSAGAVLHGNSLYGLRFPGNLGFTYPPFALLVLCPLWLLPVGVDEALVTALNAGLLVGLGWWALGLARPGAPAGLGEQPARRLRIAMGFAALALWCEPVNAAVGYGQLDIVVAALVLFDLARPADARGHGVAIGIAAGLKLTPLLFIPYLLLTRRRAGARTALIAFAATILVGTVLMPGSSLTYWSGGFLSLSHVSGRAGAGAGPADQSLRGALLRALPGLTHPTAVWLALALLVGCVGLALAVRAARRGDAAAGLLLTALTGLLVSPVSWTHQWTLVVPALLPFLVRSRPRREQLLVGTGTLAFALVGFLIWPVIHAHPLGRHLDLFGQLAGNLYVLAALVVLLAAVARELPAVRRLSRR